MNGEPRHKIFFAEFELDVSKRRLLRNGQEEVRLNPKAFDVLVFLSENAGRVVSKDEILNAVWDRNFVEEANLAVQISTLRKALDDQKGNRRLLVTVPGKGYEFVADIRTDEETVIENHSFSRLIIEEKEAANGRSSSKLVLFTILTVSVLLIAGMGLAWFRRGAEPKVTESKQPKLTRLTTSGNVSAATLTPDGQYAVFAQKEAEGESLWLRQIETGSQTRIVPAQKLDYLGLAVSPDGKFVYATVYLENRSDPPLWKIPILGGAAEEIPGVITSGAINFAPDGKRISFVESHRPETHLVVSDSDGTNKRVLLRAHNTQRHFPFEQNSSTAWSPDGKTIAVVVNEKSDSGWRAGVLLVDPADSSEQILVPQNWAFVDYVAWLDPENLVFTGYDDEWSNQIWAVSRKTRERRQITNDLQKYRWLATSGGKLLTVNVGAVGSIYAADFEENMKILQPREVFRQSGYVSYAAWGQTGDIFYSSQTTGRREIWRVGSDGTNAAQITSGADVIYGLTVSQTDGSFIFPSNRGGRISLWTTDETGKNIRQLTEGLEPIYPEVARDGTIVFQDGDYHISRISINDKTPVRLAKGLKPTISPDGKQTAFFAMDEGKWRIAIIETALGAIVKKLDLPTTVRERRMRWHPSGKFISAIYNMGENLNLLLLPVNGGETQVIENLGKGDISSFSWSADGKQILYSITRETQDLVWLTDF